jgi:hypothetical protein
MTVPCLARKLHSPCTLLQQNPGNLCAHSTHKLEKQSVHGLLICSKVIMKMNKTDLHSILTVPMTDVVHFEFLKDYTWITPLVMATIFMAGQKM